MTRAQYQAAARQLKNTGLEDHNLKTHLKNLKLYNK